MTGEVPEVVHTTAPPDFEAYQTGLIAVIGKMADWSRTSGAPGAHDHIPTGYRGRLEYIGRMLDGRFVGGYSYFARYFFEVYGDDSDRSYVQANTEMYKHAKTPFRGVNQGVEEITVRQDDREKRFLCMAMDPLVSPYDNDSNSYVTRQYGSNFLKHPMGSLKNTGRTIWLPLLDIIPDSVRPLQINGKTGVEE